MRLFGMCIVHLLSVVATLVTGSSNHENQIEAKVYQKNLEIPCFPSTTVPFRNLKWYTCRTIEYCRSHWDKNLIMYIENNTTGPADIFGMYNLSTTGILTIREVLPELNGIGYGCEVEFFSVGWKEKQIRLEIAKDFPKIMTQSPSTVCVAEGTRLDLKCEAVGFPIPDISWTHNDRLLPMPKSTEGRYVKEMSTMDDKGLYICRAENTFGVVNRSVKVNVVSLQSCWSPHSGDVPKLGDPDSSKSPPIETASNSANIKLLWNYRGLQGLLYIKSNENDKFYYVNDGRTLMFPDLIDMCTPAYAFVVKDDMGTHQHIHEQFAKRAANVLSLYRRNKEEDSKVDNALIVTALYVCIGIIIILLVVCGILAWQLMKKKSCQCSQSQQQNITSGPTAKCSVGSNSGHGERSTAVGRVKHYPRVVFESEGRGSISQPTDGYSSRKDSSNGGRSTAAGGGVFESERGGVICQPIDEHSSDSGFQTVPDMASCLIREQIMRE